jgi:germination protein M
MRLRACSLLAASALVLLLSACGSSKREAALTTHAATPAMPVASVFVRAYFIRDGKLAATGRKGVHTLAVGQASIGALLAGPNAAERKIGFSTALPENAELKKITKSGNRLTVKLSTILPAAARAQIVTTLTQFYGIRDVIIVTPASRTLPLICCANFENLMPAVLVESPLPFEHLKSPLRVSGTSNTFEATSQLELLDAKGKLLASKTVTASSGTGTRGTFSVSLRFQAPAGVATLVSYEQSAADGSRIDVVRIPIQISG